MRTKRLLTIAGCIIGSMLGLPAMAADSHQRALLEYQQLPLNFQQSMARTGKDVEFAATGLGYRVSLMPQEALLYLSGQAPVHLRLLGGDPRAAVNGLDPLPGRTFYLEGRDPAGWRKASDYARVRYHEIYPGIDLVFYGNQGRLECDFVLAPGADIRRVRFAIEGTQRVALDREGNLTLTTDGGELSLGKPLVYQQTGAARKTIAGAFQVHGSEVSFSLGGYDHNLPLVVDPTLNYAAYLGRSINDRVNGIAVGPDASTYVAGVAPAVTAASQDEAFVAHLSANGKTLLYMTYLGGTGATTARGIALDKAGNAYITGETKAPDFPVRDAFQSSCGKNAADRCLGDAFLAKLNADGSPNYATYLGGSGEDSGNAIAVDPSGDVYVAGSTDSMDFPTMHAAQPAPGLRGDAFVAKVSKDGSRLIYSTFLGGSETDQALGIALDKNLNAYVTGQTQSFDFPVKNAFQARNRLNGSNQYAQEAFVAKLSPEGDELLWSTYLGGSGGDAGNAIAVDSAGSAYVIGSTSSDDFPLANPLQPRRHGNADAFAAKLSPDGSGLVYSTFLGGSNDDLATGIALDDQGMAYISGHTSSLDFPTQGPIQTECRKDGKGECQDAFLVVLNPKGTGLRFSTFLGGTGADQGYGIAIDSKGSAYLGGASTSSDFPMGKPAAPGAAARHLGLSSITSTAAAQTSGGIIAMISGLKPDSSGCSGSINWTGTAGNNQWTTAGNWDTGVLPAATDTVCIGTAFAGVTITIGSITSVTNQTISTLVSNANISFTVGPLTVTGGADFVNTLSITGGTLTLNGTNGSAVGGAMTLNNAVLAGTDTLTITGLLTWGTNAEMCTAALCNAAGTGVTNANGGISYTTGTVYLYGRTLNNSGTATWGTTSGYNFYLAYAAVVNNKSGATWNYTNDYPTLNTSTGGGTFNNAGTFEKTAGTAITTVYAAFTNTGKVLGDSGTVTFASLAGTSTGSWSAASGDTLVLDGGTPAPSLSGNIKGAGTVSFNARTVDIIAGATFTGTGTLAIAGGTVVFETGSAVTISEAVTLAGSGILAGTDAVTINGLLTWGNSAEMCTVAACNAGGAGVTNANGGISYSTGYVYLYGRTLNNAATATLGTASAFDLYLGYAAVINNKSGAIWNYTNDYPTLNITTGGGTFNNVGTFEKTAGTATTTVYPAFTNTGRVLGNSGTVTFASLAGTSSGSWNAAAGDTVVLDGGTTAPSLSGKIIGAGTVSFNAGTVDIIAGATITGTGTLAIAGGTVIFETGSTVTIPQAVTLTSSGILAGTDAVTINGLLTWGGNAEMCTVAACNAGGTGVTNANGGISYSTGYIYLYGRTLNNAGTATWGTTSAFDLYLGYAAVINNKSGATWNYTNDYPTLNIATDGGTFNNAGTFEKTAGTATTTVYPGFTNTGKVLGNSGTVTFGSLAGTSTGSWTAAAGDTLVLDGGTPAPSLSGNITGAGTVSFNAGTVDIIAGATFTGTGTLAIAGGTVVFDTGKPVTIPQAVTLTSSGILAGTDAVTINGLLTWGGNAEMCTVAACNAGGTGVTNANGGISYSTGYVYLYGRTLNNSGTATWGTASAFSIYLDYAAVINNKVGATWNLTNDYPTLNTAGTGGKFNNFGTFEKTSGTGLTIIHPGFTNTGTVLGNSGTVRLGDLRGTSSGSWSAASGAALVLNGGTPAPSLSGNISGAGTISFSHGTVNIIAGATFTGTGPLAINGGAVVFETGSPVILSQAVRLTTKGILAGPDTVTINGLLTWENNAEMCTVAACNAGGTAVTNANGGIKYGGGYAYLYGRTLNNAGTATWGTASAFSVYLDYAAVINNKAGATWNYTNDYPTLNTTGTGGTFNNAGTFEKTAGTATTTIDPAFTNTGKVIGDSGTLTFTSLAGTSTGSWNAVSGDSLVLDGGTPAPSLSGAIFGAGAVNFSRGAFNIVAGATFTGSGAMAINGAALVFETGSTVTIPRPVTLDNSGILAGPDTVTLTGLLTWGTNGEMCAVAACNAGGTGVTNANGGINYASGYAYLYGRTLNNAGTATWGTTSAFSIFLDYAAVINNQAGATWNFTNDYPTLNTTGTGGTFNNAGTFEKTAGTATTTVYPTYTQTAGTTLLGSGSLTFGSTPTIQGGSISGTGTILGNYTGSVSTNPAGIIAPGTASAAGAIALSGTGSGNYTEGTGAFDVKIGGTAAGKFDTLTASGTATLGGALKVTLLGGFAPAANNSFTILTAGAVSGKFASTSLPSLATGLGWLITYNPTTVVLSVVATP